jgi:hypothetical protein
MAQVLQGLATRAATTAIGAMIALRLPLSGRTTGVATSEAISSAKTYRL